jgi:hypothetical protein
MTGTAATMGFLDHWHDMRFKQGTFMERMIGSRLPKKRREHNSAAKDHD